ncbi:GNAT family N-acetyltransferase [candidate division FCPU426 bacterium]|nr:GNAT family N-acetyltransferase [candidate division FCPU426 bacterium]
MPLTITHPQAQCLETPAFLLRSCPQPEDRQSLLKVLMDSLFFHPCEINVALELFEDCLLRGDASPYRFLFADQDNALVGFCSYGPIAVAPERYDLYWIAVHPQVQHLGIGSRLLQAAEAAMRTGGGKIIFIETSSRPLYDRTRLFYLKHQYQQVACIPSYYAEGDNRLVYMKML